MGQVQWEQQRTPGRGDKKCVYHSFTYRKVHDSINIPSTKMLKNKISEYIYRAEWTLFLVLTSCEISSTV